MPSPVGGEVGRFRWLGDAALLRRGDHRRARACRQDAVIFDVSHWARAGGWPGSLELLQGTVQRPSKDPSGRLSTPPARRPDARGRRHHRVVAVRDVFDVMPNASNTERVWSHRGQDTTITVHHRRTGPCPGPTGHLAADAASVPRFGVQPSPSKGRSARSRDRLHRRGRRGMRDPQ